jgi:hypothetical protein
MLWKYDFLVLSKIFRIFRLNFIYKEKQQVSYVKCKKKKPLRFLEYMISTRNNAEPYNR